MVGDDVAKRAGGRRLDVIHLNVRVVQAPNVANVHIFFAQLFGKLVHRLVTTLANGFVHLNLQHQVAAALKIQTELDAVGHILLHLRQRRGKWNADQAVNA